MNSGKRHIISDELREMAVQNGLCTQWQNSWGQPSDDELCQMYLRSLDFCIEHDYPSVEYMKEHFGGVMQKHGIYVDDKIKLSNPRKIVCNGKTDGAVSFDGFAVGLIYARHNSNISVDVRGRAIVNIICYDNASVNVWNRSDKARVHILLHGGSCQSIRKVVVNDKR